jgi:hypothetical protein
MSQTQPCRYCDAAYPDTCDEHAPVAIPRTGTHACTCGEGEYAVGDTPDGLRVHTHEGRWVYECSACGRELVPPKQKPPMTRWEQKQIRAMEADAR